MVPVRAERNSQVTGRICARICARGATGRAETGKTPKPDMDQRQAFAEISVSTGDGTRRQRRPSYCS
jgi:hypothetical protein